MGHDTEFPDTPGLTGLKRGLTGLIRCMSQPGLVGLVFLIRINTDETLGSLYDIPGK